MERPPGAAKQSRAPLLRGLQCRRRSRDRRDDVDNRRLQASTVEQVLLVVRLVVCSHTFLVLSPVFFTVRQAETLPYMEVRRIFSEKRARDRFSSSAPCTSVDLRQLLSSSGVRS